MFSSVTLRLNLKLVGPQIYDEPEDFQNAGTIQV